MSPSSSSPIGTFWFSVRSRSMISFTARSSAVILSLASSTRIWRRSPPRTVTVATPGTRSRRGDRSFSAISRSATGSRSPSSPRNMIGALAASNLKMTGGSASSGSLPRIRSSRDRRSSAASLRSVPQPKFSRIWLVPSWEVETTSSSPAMAATVCSSGRVTSSSISRGPTSG